MTMLPVLHDLIRTWAAAQVIPLTGEDAGGSTTARLRLLEGGYLVGEMRVLQVQPDPPSFHLTVMRGNMILDESWADLRGLAACLTMGLHLLQKRAKTDVPAPLSPAPIPPPTCP